ncbi:MAG: tRNA (guanine(46)-N(7))-methyltransferase TrmB [Hyphomicrobiaceae bacterium]
MLREDLPARTVDLKAPAPQRLADLFTKVDDVWLEIGFGAGEHLIRQARHHPGIGFIGAEPYRDGVVKLLSSIEQNRLDNVLCHADDVRPLLRWLPAASLGRAFSLFPDPWPKKRQQKRRLVSGDTLALLARVLRTGGELRIATDSGDYAQAILRAAAYERNFSWQADGPRDWRNRLPDWPATRYEQKAISAGRRCYYLRFVRGPVGRVSEA